MPRKRQLNKTQVRKRALDQIQHLLEEAQQVFSKNKTLANRYVQLSRKIAMKAQIRIPRELKRRFCKYCYSFLMPGKNVRIRTRDGKVIIYCLECKKYTRIPTKPKKNLNKGKRLQDK